MTSTGHDRPPDFESYWRATQDELAALPIAPEIEPIPLRTTDFATLCGVRLTSLGPYRIFGYLSIPRGAGPFPARYYLPRYQSVLEPIPQGSANGLRSQYVTLSLAARGQRNSDRPLAASFPGWLTHDIHDLQAYIFRGVVADCCRGLEYLVSLPEVDGGRIAAVGNDLALIVAALSPQVTHVVCTPALFYATEEVAPRTNQYPLEEINDYLRHDPTQREAVRLTLAHFDLRWFAPRVRATMLLMAAADGDLLDSNTLQPLIQEMAGEVTVHKAEHSTYKDGLLIEQWLTQQLGVSEAILPEAWR